MSPRCGHGGGSVRAARPPALRSGRPGRAGSESGALQRLRPDPRPPWPDGVCAGLASTTSAAWRTHPLPHPPRAKCPVPAELTKREQVIRTAVERRVSELQTEHRAAMRSAKEAWAAGERERRERASKAQEASVREATIRGLEPEVRRLMEKHR